MPESKVQLLVSVRAWAAVGANTLSPVTHYYLFYSDRKLLNSGLMSLFVILLLIRYILLIYVIVLDIKIGVLVLMAYNSYKFTFVQMVTIFSILLLSESCNPEKSILVKVTNLKGGIESIKIDRASRELDLTKYRTITRIDVNEPIPNLRVIDLTNNKISSLSNLNFAPQNITALQLGDNQLVSVQGAERFERLRFLKLSYNQIASIDGLEGLENLEFLDLSHNVITNTVNVSKLSSLIDLNLNSNYIKTIYGLAKLKKLRYLDLSANEIKALDGLEDLENLIKLYLDSNPIKVIDGIRHLKHLERLNLPLSAIRQMHADDYNTIVENKLLFQSDRMYLEQKVAEKEIVLFD